MSRFYGVGYVRSKYTGVSGFELYDSGRKKGMVYLAKKTIKGTTWTSKAFNTEIEAAKAYDMKLIENGMDPVNILKRK